MKAAQIFLFKKPLQLTCTTYAKAMQPEFKTFTQINFM
jgi:hypothetical protein